MPETQVAAVPSRVQHVGSHAVAIYSFPFAILAPTDVDVYLGEAKQANGYTVSGVGQTSGGSITFDTPPADGVIVTIARARPYSRTTNFAEGGEFHAKTVNLELNSQQMQTQQVAEEVSRALRLGITAVGTIDTTIPQPAPRRALLFDDTGSAIATSEYDPDTTVALAQTADTIAKEARDLAASAAAAAENAGVVSTREWAFTLFAGQQVYGPLPVPASREEAVDLFVGGARQFGNFEIVDAPYGPGLGIRLTPTVAAVPTAGQFQAGLTLAGNVKGGIVESAIPSQSIFGRHFHDGAIQLDGAAIADGPVAPSIIRSSSSGRPFWRQANPDIRDYGYDLVENAADDIGSRLSQALSECAALGGGVVEIPMGARCYLNSPVVMPSNTAIVGTKGLHGHINPSQMATMRPKLVVGPSGKLTLGNACHVRKLMIERDGLQWFAPSSSLSAWTGVGIEIGDETTDALVEDCAIVGFEYGIRSAAGATNVSRVRLSRLNMDNLSCVHLQNSFDVTYLDQVHCWPFATVASPPETNSPQLKRSGSGIRLIGSGDWTKLTDCFTFGYAKGLYFTDVDSVTAIGCGNDHPPTAADGSFGILIDGDSFEVALIAPQCAAKDNGIYVNTTATNGSVQIVAPRVWESRSNAIVPERGTVIIDDFVLRNTGAVGVGIAPRSTAKTIIGTGQIKGFNLGIGNQTTNTRTLVRGPIAFTGTGTPIQNPYIATLSAADPLIPDGESDHFLIVGTTSFGSMGNFAAYANRIVTLEFSSPLTVYDGGATMRLAGNFNAQAGSILTLKGGLTGWTEISRSIN